MTPETGRAQLHGLRLAARPPLPRAQAVVRAAHLRRAAASQALLRAHIALAQELAGWVAAEPGWEVSAPHPLSVVCFRYVPGATADGAALDEDALDELNLAIMHAVNAGGEVFLSNDPAARPDRAAHRDRQRAHHPRGRRPGLGPAQARGREPHVVVSATVRRGTAADEAAAGAIVDEYNGAVGVVVRDDAAALRSYLNGPGALWLAEDGAEVVGCVVLRPLPAVAPDACEVKRLYVRPAYRGAGLAGALMDALEAFARTAPATARSTSTRWTSWPRRSASTSAAATSASRATTPTRRRRSSCAVRSRRKRTGVAARGRCGRRSGPQQRRSDSRCRHGKRHHGSRLSGRADG